MATKGLIQLIFGPMYSGKTTELLKRVKDYTSLNQRCLVIKSEMDNRYTDGNKIVTHDKVQLPAVKCSKLEDIVERAKEYEVVALDQAQFFDGIAEVCERLANMGKTVIVAGLSSTFDRKNFDRMIQLIPLSDHITHLTAKCHFCEAKAPFTLRTTNEQEIQIVGGQEMYKPVCRQCYNQKRKQFKSQN